MLDDKLSLIEHSASVGNDWWSGEMSIPFSLINEFSESCESDLDACDKKIYCFNLFRVCLKDKPISKNWESTSDNSEFLCFKSTKRIDKPNFHVVEAMEKIEVVY